MHNKVYSIQRYFVRALTIKQAPQVSISESVLNNSISNTKNIENVESLPNLKTMETVTMEAVGVPPSAMTVGIPPSLPVFVRKKTILSIQGKHERIAVSNETIQFLKRLFYGNFLSRYQKLISTEPFSLLVTSNPPTLFPSLFLNVTPKSFASVKLDGINDWAILKHDALHIYSGPSLNIGMFRLPSKISRQLMKRLTLSRKEPTGLFHWARSGFTFVNGRGSIGLSGNGVIYSVNIAEGEELSVNKDSLVAVSVNGPYDLQNCIIKYTYPVAEADKKIITRPPTKMAQVHSWNDFVVNAKYYWWKVVSSYHKLRGVYPKILVGKMDFVRVIGPRSVLLQSGNPSQSFERNFLLPSGASKLPESKETSADYLNIVTIDQDGPKISSTKDFKDSVRKLEKGNS
ncbi:CIC11C00000005585 [Sungouiella intermedia]|uniref:Altered inheritance of mitochondria protein 24, mitochondrial n=1 Tax=Sungouiella intermedia TaxID=45354 RepID=A0A1L0C4B4_9ASCO|nr:CIC11C00000005585 [[Candida] intermedia]